MRLADIEQVNREMVLLSGIDRESALFQRGRQLAFMLASIRNSGIQFSDVALIEFGARHFQAYSEYYVDYDPGISEFFSLHSKEIGLRYLAFDQGLIQRH